MLESNNTNSNFLINMAVKTVKEPTYVGINSKGRACKVLDQNGNVGTKNGRNIRQALDTLAAKLHIIDKDTFQGRTAKRNKSKTLSDRRASVISGLPSGNTASETGEGVKEILNMLTSQKNISLTAEEKNAIQPVIDADLKTYLTTAIKKCSSGEKLVALKKQIDDLANSQTKNNISIEVLESLKRKACARMKDYIQAMPKHLEQTYQATLFNNLKEDNMADCKEKYLAIGQMFTYINSLTSADSEEQFVEQKQTLRDLMVTTFNSDVKRLANSCLKGADLQKSNELYKLITAIKEDTIDPFFDQTSDKPMEYTRQINDVFNKKSTALDTQVQTAPRLLKKMQNCIEHAGRLVVQQEKDYKAHGVYKTRVRNTTSNRSILPSYRLIAKIQLGMKIEKNRINKIATTKKIRSNVRKLRAIQSQYNKCYLKLDAHVERYGASLKMHYADINDASVASPQFRTPVVIAAAGNSYQKPLTLDQFNDPARLQPSNSIESFNQSLFDNYCHLEAPTSKNPTPEELMDFKEKLRKLNYAHYRLATKSLAIIQTSDKAENKLQSRHYKNKKINELENNKITEIKNNKITEMQPYDTLNKPDIDQGDDLFSSQTSFSDDDDFNSSKSLPDLPSPPAVQSAAAQRIIDEYSQNQEVVQPYANLNTPDSDQGDDSVSRQTSFPDDDDVDSSTSLPDLPSPPAVQSAAVQHIIDEHSQSQEGEGSEPDLSYGHNNPDELDTDAWFGDDFDDEDEDEDDALDASENQQADSNPMTDNYYIQNEKYGRLYSSPISNEEQEHLTETCNYLKDIEGACAEDVIALSLCFANEMRTSVAKSSTGGELFLCYEEYIKIFQAFTEAHINNKTPWSNDVVPALQQLIKDGLTAYQQNNE